MFKWLGRFFVLGVLIVVIIGGVTYCDFRGTQPPSLEDAPYALQGYYETDGLKIPTRIYYAEKIELVDGKALLETYWTLDGTKFKKHEGRKEVYPPYSVIRRFEQ
jgi:hypothetical protein